MRNKKIILYLGGGCMSGIFGAGIVTALEEKNLYNKIKAVYGESAGAINAAYFLARQSVYGATIYYEDLLKGFVRPWLIPYGSWQRFCNRNIYKISRKNIKDVVDINYLFKIIKTKKILDVKRMKSGEINFYVKVLNIDTGRISHLNVKKGNSLKILKAAASVVPYYFSSQRIGGKRYIDTYIKEPIGLAYLLKKYPKNKIVVCINYPIKGFSDYSYFIRDVLEYLVTKNMYKTCIYEDFKNRTESMIKDVELVDKNKKRVLLIYPPENNPSVPWTIDKKKLLTTYKMGQRQINKILKFIK